MRVYLELENTFREYPRTHPNPEMVHVALGWRKRDTDKNPKRVYAFAVWTGATMVSEKEFYGKTHTVYTHEFEINEIHSVGSPENRPDLQRWADEEDLSLTDLSEVSFRYVSEVEEAYYDMTTDLPEVYETPDGIKISNNGTNVVRTD